WIRQRALEGVILPFQPLGEFPDVGVQNLEPAAIELLQPCLSARHPERCPTLGAGLGENERSVGKVEGSEPELSWNLRSGSYPAQTSGNHQMYDEKKIVLELEHDTLSHPPHAGDGLAVGGADWRVN